MSSNAKAQTLAAQPSGTAPRVCAICGRALAGDDEAIHVAGVSAHVTCAAYRRRRIRT
jgi:hypothetical protein